MEHYMKRRILWCMIVFCISLRPLSTHAELAQVATFEYPPVMDSNKEHGGLMGEIVTAAFHEVNVETDLVYYPAKRVLLNFIGKTEYIACVGPISLIDRQSEKEQHQVIRVPPLIDIIMVLTYYKPTHGNKPTTFEDLSELSGFRVGTILGSNTIPLLQKAGIKISEASIESQIRMLKAGRIDFAAVGILTGSNLIAHLYPDHKKDFAIIRKPIMDLPTSIYFNKNHPKGDEYADKFRTGLKAILENGQYVKILEKYYGQSSIPSEYTEIFHTLGIQYTF